MRKMVLLATVFLLSACGRFDHLGVGGNGRENQERQGKTNLDGAQVFRSDCITEKTQGEAAIRELQVTDTDFLLITLTYNNTTCSGDVYSQTRTLGTYALGKTNPNLDTELNLDASSIKMTYNSEDMTTYLNRVSYCGISNWKTGVTREVIGLTCGYETFPKATYSILRYQGTSVLLGTPDLVNDGLSEGKRHKTLDKNPLKRVN